MRLLMHLATPAGNLSHTPNCPHLHTHSNRGSWRLTSFTLQLYYIFCFQFRFAIGSSWACWVDFRSFHRKNTFWAEVAEISLSTIYEFDVSESLKFYRRIIYRIFFLTYWRQGLKELKSLTSLYMIKRCKLEYASIIWSSRRNTLVRKAAKEICWILKCCESKIIVEQ